MTKGWTDWDGWESDQPQTIDVYEPDHGYPTGILDAQGREIMRQRRHKIGFDLSKKVKNGQ